MKAKRREMHLALMLDGVGGHVSSWLLPSASYGPEEFSVLLRSVRSVEDAKFDMIFMADSPSAQPIAGGMMRPEPLTTLAALSQVTTNIGLAATVSTTYGEPYNVARMLGSIDKLSKGRVGWNVVTTSNAAAAYNFGDSEHASKSDRYEMAAEFVQVCKGLWDSWEDGAEVPDRAGRRLADLAKQHTLNHTGKHFSVKGPLNQSRPPQGYPVIIQAGASETGIPFAGAIGEVIFTVQEDIEATKAFGGRIREEAAKAGRDPNLIRILPGVCPFVAESEEEARQMLWDVSEHVDGVAAWAKLRSRLGVEVEHLDPDGPVPVIPREEMRGHAKTLSAVATKFGLNLRQLRDYAAAASGHRLLFGSPEMIADDLEQWFESGAADGFIIIPPWLHAPLDAFTQQVVPILQKRGLFRTEYNGSTLREHLGLPRPQHPSASKEFSD